MKRVLIGTALLFFFVIATSAQKPRLTIYVSRNHPADFEFQRLAKASDLYLKELEVELFESDDVPEASGLQADLVAMLAWDGRRLRISISRIEPPSAEPVEVSLAAPNAIDANYYRDALVKIRGAARISLNEPGLAAAQSPNGEVVITGPQLPEEERARWGSELTLSPSFDVPSKGFLLMPGIALLGTVDGTTFGIGASYGISKPWQVDAGWSKGTIWSWNVVLKRKIGTLSWARGNVGVAVQAGSVQATLTHNSGGTIQAIAPFAGSSLLLGFPLGSRWVVQTGPLIQFQLPSWERSPLRIATGWPLLGIDARLSFGL